MGVAVIAVIAATVLAQRPEGESSMAAMHPPNGSRSAAEARSPYPAGTAKEFRYLAAQSSNFCSLKPEAIGAYSMSRRLQGSCCNAMDLGTYQAQVRRLRAYHSNSVVPTDPYDIPVSLARRLLGLDQSIELTAAQQAVYDDAMRMTPDKGPCCCHCWRWNADEGLAKYLITVRHFDAPRVAALVALVNGCGGKHSSGLTAA